MQITPEAVHEALGILGWGQVKSHRTKKLMWPPQGHRQLIQEVRIDTGPTVTIEIRTRVTPTEQHPSRVRWDRVASIPYSEIRVTESGHLRLGPFTL
jgi:hypothetical protein